MAKRTPKSTTNPVNAGNSPGFSKLQIEYWPIGRLKPYERNARKNDHAVDRIVQSLKAYGFAVPVLVKQDGTVVDGHLRLKGAVKMGMAEVPVIVCNSWSEAQVRAFRLMANRSVNWAEWDLDILADEMKELAAMDLDLSLTGFDEAEFVQFVAGAGLTDPDEVPPAPERPVTRTGDLWCMGEHRLLCGDATRADDAVRLMAGESAGLMNIDPPYGVGYANEDRPNPGVAKPRVAGDAFKDKALQGFLESAFSVALLALRPNAAWYLWHAHLTQGFFAAAAAAAHVILHRQIIWVKPVLLLTRGQYHWKHEPCFMGWVEHNEPPDYGRGAGERDQTTIWEIASVTQAERKEFNHATPKPVGLFEIPIIKHLKPHEIAYDPFAGSGPQFIAAEMTGRKCYGMEIEPKYCDCIVTRWQNFTGREATLDGHGATFAHVKEGRLLGEQDAIKEEALT